MIRRFDEPENRHRPERALQIYQVLIGLARNRQTITYSGLAEIVGFRGEGVFGQTLGLIMHWCGDNELPALTSLVVGKTRGTPGVGLQSTPDTQASREEVYQYPWYEIFPPTLDELRALKDRK